MSCGAGRVRAGSAVQPFRLLEELSNQVASSTLHACVKPGADQSRPNESSNTAL